MKTARMIVKLSIVALIAGAGVRPAGATLLAGFSFDSMSGQTVTDISGNNHNATFSTDGTPVTLSNDNPFNASPATGYVQQGKSAVVNLSGGGTYKLAYLANPGTIDLNNGGQNKFTLEGWIKPAVLQSSSLLELDNGSGSGFYYYLGMNGSGKPVAAFYSGEGWVNAGGTTSLTLDQWTHLAMVYDGATVHLYVNGADVADAVAGQAVPNSMGAVYFGGGGSLGQVNGLIDDLAIFNTALEPSQLGYSKSFTELVPEPSSLALLALGGLLVWRRRTK